MSETNDTKKVLKPIERVTILEGMKPKLQSLCDQANEALQGMASISKSDIVNLLLEAHSGTLTKVETESLRATHFDEVRFAQWMANRLKTARTSGESVSLMDLVERGKELVAGPREKTPRRPRKRKERTDETEESTSSSEPVIT